MSPTPAFGAASGAPALDVPRHGGNGNPLILLPEHAPDTYLAGILRKKYDQRTAAEKHDIKGKYAYYSRASSAGKAIDDSKALEKWGRRMVAVGLAARRDLQLSVAAHAMDPESHKKELDDLCEQAIEAAKASAAATVGTALHKLAEYVDQGVDVPGIDDAARRDLEAYKQCMVRHGATMNRTERFVVCDELGVAGTFDREMSIRFAPGVNFVGDLKTGNVAKTRDGQPERDAAGRIVLAYVTSMAVQLGVYAHSSLYDPTDGSRTPLDVNLKRAIVIHLPQGSGECELHLLNIEDGWEAAKVAAWARGWQRRRDLSEPLAVAS